MNRAHEPCLTIIDELSRLISFADTEEDISQLYGAGEAVINFYEKSLRGLDDYEVILGEVMSDMYLEALSEAAQTRADELRESAACV